MNEEENNFSNNANRILAKINALNSLATELNICMKDFIQSCILIVQERNLKIKELEEKITQIEKMK